jgi:hypothetical protein
MFYVNDFIEWTIDNNGPTLNFNKNERQFNKCVTSYIDFIRERHANRDFIEKIADIEEWFSKHQETNETQNTLRMSLFELD